MGIGHLADDRQQSDFIPLKMSWSLHSNTSTFAPSADFMICSIEFLSLSAYPAVDSNDSRRKCSNHSLNPPIRMYGHQLGSSTSFTIECRYCGLQWVYIIEVLLPSDSHPRATLCLVQHPISHQHILFSNLNHLGQDVVICLRCLRCLRKCCNSRSHG